VALVDLFLQSAREVSFAHSHIANALRLGPKLLQSKHGILSIFPVSCGQHPAQCHHLLVECPYVALNLLDPLMRRSLIRSRSSRMSSIALRLDVGVSGADVAGSWSA